MNDNVSEDEQKFYQSVSGRGSLLENDSMHHSQAYVADHFSVGSAHGEVMTSDRKARRRVVKKKKKKVRKSSTMVVKNSEEEVADATE